MTANQTEKVAPAGSHSFCTEAPTFTACSPSLPCGTLPWRGALAFSLPLCRGAARHPVETDRQLKSRDRSA